MISEADRDHLFISYATEDSDFAEWLALRLAAEGYRVWCDRTHLLGGESYPRDIDRAIKERTFRLLALLSRASLQKSNPIKERTIALNIARERGVDFLIPLNVDGLSATELDWMISDLTFIPFHANWAAGFGQLLKKLKSIGTPRDVAAGRTDVCDWMAIRAEPIAKEEKLWANMLPVIEVPNILHKYELRQRGIPPALREHWPCYTLANADLAWAFGPPDPGLGVTVTRAASTCWQDVPEFDSLRMGDIALAVLRKAITVRCLQKGMKLVPKSRYPYFPDGLLPENRLKFAGYDGKQTHLTAVGERTFRSGEGRERIRYHLFPMFRLTSTELGRLAVRVSMHLYLTDLRGFPLESPKALRRRKRICKNWWNHEWLLRFLAVVEWLCEGQTECELLRTANGCFRIASEPIMLSADEGINESALKTPPAVDDAVEIDEDADGSVGDFDSDGEEEGELEDE